MLKDTEGSYEEDTLGVSFFNESLLASCRAACPSSLSDMVIVDDVNIASYMLLIFLYDIIEHKRNAKYDAEQNFRYITLTI